MCFTNLSDRATFYYPYEPLVRGMQEDPWVERDTIGERHSAKSLFEKKIVIEDLNKEDIKENKQGVYLAKFHLCEVG